MFLANIKRKQFSFTWKIVNFSSCYERNEDELCSPSFVAENLNSSRWYLSFYPRGVGTEYEDYVSLYLYLCDDNEHIKKMFVAFELKILLSNGKCLETFNYEYEFKAGNSWGSSEMLKRKQLFESMENSNHDTLVIVCRITKNSKLSKKASTCLGETRIGVSRCSYLWNVPFFICLSWNEKKKFELFGSCFVEVTLTCRKDDVVIHICLVNPENELPMHVTCKISLLDKDGIEKKFLTDSHLFASSRQIWSFPSFFKKSYLEIKNDTFLLNGSFSLKLNFSSSNGTKATEIIQYKSDESVTDSKYESYSTMCNDFQNMLKEKEYSDVQIQIGDQKIPAHKCVLSARSPVFKIMFEQNMTESLTGVVNITDHDVTTVQAFLDFVYTDSVNDMDFNLALELLVIADKYQVSSLEKKCTSFLESVLSGDNVCKILQVSDLLINKSLKKSAINFITNNSGEILLSSKWSALVKENCKLGSEVVTELSKLFGNMNNINFTK